MKSELVLLFLILVAGFTSVGQGYGYDPDVEEKGLIKVSVMYPDGEGKHFDMDYYKTKHMPMVAGFLGSNLVKYTIEKGLASSMPNQPLPYVAIGTFYVKNIAEYHEAIAPNREAIRADILNYTNIAPVIFISELVEAE
ncbi:MAG TPA: EthD family reductase [Cyclobacteriaceae bacterium]|jgi:uncharacterized protein (TIGR02118 family)